METRRLYYEDSHIREFSARVESCAPTERGFRIILDQTAFYPEGGGQGCDLGTIENATVLDVQEEGEQVIHFCDRPLPVGASVQGAIQWERRFDLMQQHTGEHLLSGVIHKLFGYHNSGFHLGAEVMEVDFDGPIPGEMLSRIEEMTNRLVWENLPVNCDVPSKEALAGLTYRTKRELPWPVRIVEIPGGDCCACCGVHVGHTGEVGMVKILSCTKFHSGVRLEVVCGKRAYDYMEKIFLQNRSISQLLSAKMDQTYEAVEKLNSAYTDTKYQLTGMGKRLLQLTAQGYEGKKNPICFTEGITAVRELAERIAAVSTGRVVVASGSDAAGYQLCILVPGGDAAQLGAAAMQALSGKGGGRGEAFSGTVKTSQAQIRSFFEQERA